MYKDLRKIEKLAYPKGMRQLGSVRNISDLAEYMECHEDEVVVLQGEGWYILIADHQRGDVELVDIASSSLRLGVQMWRALVGHIIQLSGRRVTMDARESTSYPMVRKLAERGVIEILSDATWEWCGEVFHDLIVGVK